MKINHLLKILCMLLNIFFYSIMHSKNNDQSICIAIDQTTINDESHKHQQSLYTSSTIHPASDNYSNKDYEQLFIQAIVSEIACQEAFHMTLAQKKQMKRLSYDNFVSSLLQRQDLSNESVMKLWKEYKNKRVWNLNNEKEDNEAKITKALKKREQKRKKEELEQKQQKQQLNQRKQRYDGIVLYNMDYQSLFDQQRKTALHQTKATNYAQYEQNYSFDSQTTGMLQAQGIHHQKFQSLSGTIFQHQLFCEAADCYKKTAKIIFQHAVKHSLLAPSIVQLAQASFESTKLEIFDLSIQLNNLADLLAETSLSVCKGVIESTCNLVDMGMHPIRTVQQIGTLLVPVLRTLGGALNAYDHESSVYVQHLQVAQQAFGSDIQIFNQMCKLCKQECAQWYQNSSKQEKVQALSRCLGDLVLQPKLIGMTSKACGNILLEVKKVELVEKIVELTEELNFSFSKAQEVVFATEEGLELLPTSMKDFEIAATNFIESEHQQIINALEPCPLKLSEPEAFAKGQSLIDQIQSIMGTEIIDIKKLADAKKMITVNFEELLQNMLIDIEHIFIPEIKFRWNYDSILDVRFLKDFGLAGWHYGYLKEFEKAGLIKVLKTVVKNDCVYAEFLLPYSKSVIKKTFYPEHWSKMDVIETIKHAVSNPYKIITKENSSLLHKTLYSRLENGTEMISYLGRDFIDEVWNIKSSFIAKDWILK